MKERKRENRLTALALCLALVAAVSLGLLALAGSYGRASIVPLGTKSGDAVPAARTAQSRYTGWELDPTEIYSIAAAQTVIVQARKPDTGAVHAYGAGFFISESGYIMTNCHVVSDSQEKGEELQVRTFDGHTYQAELVGADQDADIALLKVSGAGIDPAVLGNSDQILPCQTVYIMGHPADELSFTMTSGIISALGRTITFSDGTTLDMFQLDAAVNFGNSGGPVYNSRGQVIGITTAKYSGLYSEGLGFAIPINDAARIAEDLRKYGFVRGRPLMGITVQTVWEDELEEGKSNPAGVLVHHVTSGLCGDRAGLRKGDIIISLNDTRVESTQDLVDAKKPFRAGDTVTLEVWRDGETFTTQLTFDEVTPEHPTGSVSLDELEEDEPEEETETEPED